MAKMTEKQRDAMFAAWQEKQAVHYVAQKLQISRMTVRKYRVSDHWDARMAKIVEKARGKSDNEAAKRRSRWMKQGQALQKVGTRKFYDDQGNIIPAEIKRMTAGEAIKAIGDGIRIEREAVGENGEKETLTLEITLVGKSG